LYIKLFKANKKHKYSVVVTRGSASNQVVEKIGSYSIYDKKLVINPFRLVFWFSKCAGCSANAFTILQKFKVL